MSSISTFSTLHPLSSTQMDREIHQPNIVVGNTTITPWQPTPQCTGQFSKHQSRIDCHVSSSANHISSESVSPQWCNCIHSSGSEHSSNGIAWYLINQSWALSTSNIPSGSNSSWSISKWGSLSGSGFAIPSCSSISVRFRPTPRRYSPCFV